jgi:ParG
MTGKKVSIGAKPISKPTPDDWVQNRGATTTAEAPEPETTTAEAPEPETTTAEVPKPEKEKLKRLTIDISESLHREIKSQCAMRGTQIADEVRELLAQKYGKS